MSVARLDIEHGGVTRTCRIYRPDRLASPAGLVVMLHPAVGSGEEFARLTGFDQQAQRLGWVAAYPDAWNPGPSGGWDTYGCCPNEYDDVGFIAALIARVVGDNRLDPNRVFVAGFSRGGMMAHRVGCELSRHVAGIAAVAGNMADPSGSTEAVPCGPGRPVAVLIMHGSDDRNVPVEGGASPDYPEQLPYAPLSDVVSRWRAENQCTHTAPVRQAGNVTIRRWDGDAPVELHLVIGGGHEWFPRAGQTIADFFAANPWRGGR
jgi:polyhydroxybutyrate depolymerase